MPSSPRALYPFWILGQALLEGRLRELMQRTTMQRAIDRLEDHVIICGYGRFGRVVVEELVGAGIPIVAIDSDPGQEEERPSLESVSHLAQVPSQSERRG
jgi:voltage-gated potassium channel